MTPREDIHCAARLLWDDLKVHPWFVAYVVHPEERKIVLEVKILSLAQTWSGREWFGFLIETGKCKKMVS